MYLTDSRIWETDIYLRSGLDEKRTKSWILYFRKREGGGAWIADDPALKFLRKISKSLVDLDKVVSRRGIYLIDDKGIYLREE